MKNTVLSVLMFALMTLLLPLAGLLTRIPQHSASLPHLTTLPELSESGFFSHKAPEAKVPDTPAPAEPLAAPVPMPDKVLLKNAADGSLIEVSPLEYMIGAAASEMPITWPDEALKAQAAASLSYLLYQRDNCEDPSAGWLTVDPARRQGFMTKEVLQSYWGEGFEQNWQKLEALFTPLQNTLILYDGKPAGTCYHAISSGRTESSGIIWDQELPYLCGVDSVGDLTADDYTVTVTYTPQQMVDALTVNFAGISLTGDPGSWFGEFEASPAGTIKWIDCCGTRLRGIDLRRVLGLRSAVFSINYQDDVFVITTRGYGHGVGLSQWGAKSMAEAGQDWKAILTHYFPGTQITE